MSAANKEEARRAEDIAKGTPGVKAVESHIRVAEADTSEKPPG